MAAAEHLSHGRFFGICEAVRHDDQHPHAADHTADAVVVPATTARAVRIDPRRRSHDVSGVVCQKHGRLPGYPLIFFLA